METNIRRRTHSTISLNESFVPGRNHQIMGTAQDIGAVVRAKFLHQQRQRLFTRSPTMPTAQSVPYWS